MNRGGGGVELTGPWWKGNPDIVFAVSGAAIYGGLSALTVEIRDLAGFSQSAI